MTEEIYIPPTGISFRLLGYLSQNVIFSRNSPEPQVYTHPAHDDYADHYFTLVPGTGARQGSYLIKSTYTGKVLFSRTHATPYVWHTDSTAYPDDNWFKLQPGTGKYSKQFRLRTPYNDRVMFNRTAVSPYIGNHPASDDYADHYFSFLFEDMKIERIEYELKLGRIISSTPTVLANQTLDNKDSTEAQEMKFEFNRTETHTSTFEYSEGFTITIGTTVKGGIPLVAEAEFRVDVSSSTESKWGEQTSIATSYIASFPVHAGPGKVMKAVSTVNKGDIEVPYTIHLISKKTGTRTQTKGMWRGVSTWDLRATFTEEK